MVMVVIGGAFFRKGIQGRGSLRGEGTGILVYFLSFKAHVEVILGHVVLVLF